MKSPQQVVSAKKEFPAAHPLRLWKAAQQRKKFLRLTCVLCSLHRSPQFFRLLATDAVLNVATDETRRQ